MKHGDRCWTCGVGKMIERRRPTIITVACSQAGCPAFYTKKVPKGKK